MVQDYRQLWKDAVATNAIDKAGAVRILAEIVADSNGRAFVRRLGSQAAKSCVEILDYVSCCPPFAASDGLVRVSGRRTSGPPRRALSSSR